MKLIIVDGSKYLYKLSSAKLLKASLAGIEIVNPKTSISIPGNGIGIKL